MYKKGPCNIFQANELA